MKTRLKRVLSLALTALMLLMLVPGAFASEIVTSEPVVPGLAVEKAAEPEKSAADALYERLMACTTCDEFAAALEALTEEENTLLDAFTDEQNTALEAMLQAMGWYDATTLENRSYTIIQGESQDVTVNVNNLQSNSFSITSCEPSQAEITVSPLNGGYRITVTTTVPAADYTLTITYRAGTGKNAKTYSDTVKVTVSKVPVHVYVASSDSKGNSWRDNAEFQDLIKLYVCDNNGYFPAGTIYLDASYFSGKTNADTSGAALINSANDWRTLLGLLENMDNTNLSGSLGAKWASNNKALDFSNNNENKVSDYLKQAEEVYNYGWGSKHTALFRWNKNFEMNDPVASHLGHYGDTTTKYHLDLCFNTNKITFIFGNNGIDSGEAKDGTPVDSRVYITGSTIQNPRNLKIPAGYQLEGYYKDADFNEKWDDIGKPLNENQTVYIKIIEKAHVQLNYKVAQGSGSVSPESEKLNPEIGIAAGSTATADDGWAFDGWYTDEACTDKIDTNGDPHYTPTRPDTGWVDDTTYWAKFVRVKVDLTITKQVTGNMGDRSKSFEFEVTSTEAMTADDTSYTLSTDGKTATFSLTSGNSVTLKDVTIGADLTISEKNATGYTVTITPEGSAIKQDNGSYKVTVAGANTSLTVINRKDAIPDMGVLLDSLPYILILAVVVAVGAFVFIRKRREHDDD